MDYAHIRVKFYSDKFGFSSVIELVDKLIGLNKRPVIILKYLQRDLGICWRFVHFHCQKMVQQLRTEMYYR